MQKQTKKSLTKISKSKKSTLKNSKSIQYLQSKSKSKLNKTLTKSSLIIHDTNTKILTMSKSQIKLSQQKTKKKCKNKNIGKKIKKKDKSKNGRNQQSIGLENNYIIEEKQINHQQKVELFEYFIYNNTFIPIENSQQRRFVQKIKLIELNKPNKEKSLKNIQVQYNKQLKIPQLSINQTQTTHRFNNSIQIQTDNFSNRSSQNKQGRIQQLCMQKSQKCFNNILADLQFLYLPDNRNFQKFSTHQCKHYHDLFLNIASKFQNNSEKQNQKFNQCIVVSDQTIIVMLYQRQCMQMGWMDATLNQGFPTHIFSILSYISNLFCYAQLKEKQSIVTKMNTIYSYPYPQRFVRSYKNQSTRKVTSIISNKLFLALEEQLFGNHQFPNQIIEDAIHAHNRAIFDSVNQFLQEFKPFYHIGGQPFPWNNSIGMTFYSIDQDSIQLLFNQVKDKIVQAITNLCGIHLQYSQIYPNVKQHIVPHPFHLQRIKQQQIKMINQQSKKIQSIAEIQEQYVRIMVSIGQSIEEQMINELVTQFIIKQ